MGLNIEKYSTEKEALQHASTKLAGALDYSVKMLLLLSGGSSLKVAAAALKNLDKKQKKLITIAQIDERYGSPGHKDSNWNGVEQAAGDLNEYAGAVRVLGGGSNIEEDSAYYEARLRELFDENIIKIGLYGVGADGHIAGMLPGEEASFLKYVDGRLVVNFVGSDFPRITTTSALMKVLDKAIVFASGTSKEQAILSLDQELPVNEHPAQLLKIVNEAWVFYGKETK